MEKLETSGRSDPIQTTELFQLTRILWRILQIWEDMLSQTPEKDNKLTLVGEILTRNEIITTKYLAVPVYMK